MQLPNRCGINRENTYFMSRARHEPKKSLVVEILRLLLNPFPKDPDEKSPWELVCKKVKDSKHPECNDEVETGDKMLVGYNPFLWLDKKVLDTGKDK